MTRMDYLAKIRKAIAERDGRLPTMAEYQKSLSQKKPQEKDRH